MNKITFKDATSAKVYSHFFTGRDGIAHGLTAWCDTDDEEMMDAEATWSVQDDARSDGEVRTHSAEDEMEMLTNLSVLAGMIERDFAGIKLGFDFADQCFIQC